LGGGRTERAGEWTSILAAGWGAAAALALVLSPGRVDAVDVVAESSAAPAASRDPVAPQPESLPEAPRAEASPLAPDGASPGPEDAPTPLVGAGGSAAVPPPGAVLWEIPTFWYLEPERPDYLRAAAELALSQAIALTGYVIVDPPSTVAGTPNPVPVWGKLTLQPWGLTWDADDWTTNFRGHVTSGAIYWLLGRGNRLTVLESLAFSVATGIVWELVEFHEPAALNDLIVTPFGGMAIGEVLVQLGSYLDRSPPTLFNQALAWILTAPKKVHDWIDGAKVRRDPPDPGWHRFSFGASAGLVNQGGGFTDWGARLALGTEIFRAAGYGTAGRASRAMNDAVQSSLAFEAGFAGGEVYDVQLSTRFAAWGWYQKDIEGDRDDLRGHDLFAGLTFGLDYFEHDWFRAAASRVDQMECIQLLGGTLQLRVFRAPWEADFRLDVAGQFGGVRPFPMALGTVLPTDAVLPNVTYAQGYYYAFGLMVAPRLEVRLGPLAIGGSWRIDAFSSVHGRDLAPYPGDPVDLQDRRSEGRAWARWLFPSQGVEIGLVASRLVRWGRVDAVEEWQGETDVWATIGLGF